MGFSGVRTANPAQGVALASVFAIPGMAAQTAAAREKLRLWFWRTALAARAMGLPSVMSVSVEPEGIDSFVALAISPDLCRDRQALSGFVTRSEILQGIRCAVCRVLFIRMICILIWNEFANSQVIFDHV